MDVLGPAPATLTNEQIIEQYDSALTQIIKASLDTGYDFERQILVNQARLCRQSCKGNHFSVPREAASTYGQISEYMAFDGGEEEGPDIKLCPRAGRITTHVVCRECRFLREKSHGQHENRNRCTVEN
jgi:hypothetical protein